jgi:hypothetical protein
MRSFIQLRFLAILSMRVEGPPLAEPAEASFMRLYSPRGREPSRIYAIDR